MIVALKILSAAALWVTSSECVRLLQGVGYKARRGYIKIYCGRFCLLLIAAQAAVLPFGFFGAWWAHVATFVLLAATATVMATRKRKVPLKFTPRVKRLLAAELALLVAASLFAPVQYFVLALPLVTLAAHLLCLPIEVANNARYVRKASKIFASTPAVKIAVTGSFGKTSVKNMLAALLPNAVASPENYNTPLGMCRFANSADFSQCDYIVAELGARKRGDIAELCKMVRPNCGVVTGVAPQHLETFGSLENVARTKRELTENIPADGFCMLNGKDGIVRTFANFGRCEKIVVDDDLIKISDIVVTAGGVEFTAECEEICRVKLPIMSLAAVDNFRLCAAVCRKFGMTLRQICDNAQNVRQLEHRMQVTHNGKFYVVDDSYNASIYGVKSCCDTLAKLNGAKFAVAQGIVETGKDSERQNVAVGEMLGKVCSAVAVVGKNSKFLERGLCNVGCNVICAESLADAVAKLQGLLTHNCFLLFQNDLPDNIQ